ncbi:short-chain collagen C4-like isoform X2 [Mytilus californianus]|nr:short-chain collagen C4-like isoform X2 [Mytilus californianus]XP_052064414.1 short-chain collagen C4-like isoform X2 [Mytilus californianus]XP_052064415.1 short-chain collagen C4-like isoform X2 [Mytilus californianus]
MLLYLAFITATLTVLVQCHDCKDYDLSASDQSLVDMMKHYLHTSRKEECPPGGKSSTSGVTYVRWGKKGCPNGVDMIYTGQVGGNYYSNKGGCVNYLCLPNDPENGDALSSDNGQLYGTEYETAGSHKPSGMKDMRQKEVPCAVCHQRKRSVLLMIPARKTCYKGWTSEYSGYLLTDHKTYSSKEYLCVDKNAEPLDNKTGNEDGALLYGISAKCGSLRCPPYKDATDVRCVVCTK